MWNPYFYWYFRLNLQILIQKKILVLFVCPVVNNTTKGTKHTKISSIPE